jgi:hypothetical protein
MKPISALYNYIDAKIVNAIPGANILAGWKAFAWGHRGPSAKPAALHAILESFDVTQVGRCRLTVSNPELKARLVSALETKI